jgi:signal transduction histidine kinase
MADAGFSFEQQDHLAELGRIAGPLVHELKNPLGVILLNAELMAKDLPRLPEAERERVAKRLRRIDASARNLQMVVQSFLAYARPVRPEPGAIDLNIELRRVLDEQHEALAAAAIEVHFHPDPALCLVPGDRGHLRSIFTNIIVNARDALLERPTGRRLVVLTRTAQNASRVVIANNGPPLGEGVAARLFEPFTSTKEHGTGLGLAIVRRLVEMHNGTVAVSSDKDQGVSFTCEFPTPLGPSLAQGEIGYADIGDGVSASGEPAAPAATEPDPPARKHPKKPRARRR